MEGEETCPLEDLEAENIRCAGPLHFSLDVGISADSLWAKGSLQQQVELQCVSCLEKFTYVIEVPAFAVHTETAGPETVDLTPLIREDLLLSLPAHPHCDRDGKRVCKAAHPDATPQEEKRKPDWSPLDKLKLKR